MLTKNKSKLYLASSSQTRQNLLKISYICYEVIGQDADERLVDWNMPLNDLVCSLAELKMAHIKIPKDQEFENNIIFVLSADTLTEDAYGNILGKPKDREDAKNQIIAARLGSKISTGFCLERKIFKSGSWITNKKITKAVNGYCKLVIPDDYIDFYLDNSGALYGSGAIIIDDIGNLFLKEVSGSYTAILGLPLFEIREALEDIGFVL